MQHTAPESQLLIARRERIGFGNETPAGAPRDGIYSANRAPPYIYSDGRTFAPIDPRTHESPAHWAQLTDRTPPTYLLVAHRPLARMAAFKGIDSVT